MIVRIQYCVDGTGYKLYNVFYKIPTARQHECFAQKPP